MTRPTSSSAPAGRNPWLIGGVIALAVLAGILLTLVLTRSPETASESPSASTSASESPLPSESAPASAEPSEEPSEAPAPSEEPGPTPVVDAPDGILPPGSMARVAVDSVRVRAEPSTGGDQVGTLARDELVALGFSLVADWGPREADGFRWYPVHALGMTDVPPVTELLEGNKVYGWVAAGDETSAFLELVPPRCVEGDPDLELLQNLLPWEQLACYGDRSITFEATYGCGGCGGLYPGTFEPPWLASPLNFHIVSVDPNVRVGPMAVRFSPDGPEPPEFASILQITGHFDDPAAAGCTVAPGEPPSPIDPTAAELYCREEFVVDGYEVIGHDDDFLGG